MDPVVIVSAFRTPLGAFNGKLKSLTTPELGATAIKKVSERLGAKIDSVYMGCVLSAGLGQSAARQAALGADLDKSVHCVNVNKICGSGMAALMLARNSILAGEDEVAIAGGMESMTNAPYLLEKARFGYRFGDGTLKDHMLTDGLLDAYDKCVMGSFAEDTAEEYSFSRKDQDEYTMNSFLKARRAMENGFIKNEIAKILVKDKKGDILVDEDEIPFSVDTAKMKNLKPAFRANGTITAASASSVSDGAAAVLLMKESKSAQWNVAPLARIVAQSCFSLAPKQFATAPIGAIKSVLQKSNWSIEDVDLFEINEAFAVVPMVAAKELDIDSEKINIFGGACALGHPLGASGARIVVTLLNAMKIKNARRGLATLCVGGGEGVAMTFETIHA
ncbi:MAG: thiolase family protein [Holosporaceae bacterium]|jgi:acetyl-CoA C-acetyltransferase|nr:thiolase family protein [Holosporaceae bacterium]